MPSMTRRAFASTALSGGMLASQSSASAQQAADFAIEDQEPFKGQTRRLKVTNGGRFVTALIFSTDYPTHFRLKPELYPVLTPGGLPVTDTHSYCFIHHQSIMAGHGKVWAEGSDQPVDFYRKLDFPQDQRADRWHRDFNLFTLGPSGIQAITAATWEAGGHAQIELALEWRTRERNTTDGELLLIEKRRYEIRQAGAFTIVDHFSRLSPAGAPVVLKADRHSFCGVRVNDLIDVEDGGTMTDSLGRVNPSGDYWDTEGERQAPLWVDCTGRIGSEFAGVTLIGHPANARNQFYMREWGLMEVSPTLGDDLRITAATPMSFAARYLAHDGWLDVEATREFAAAFAQRPLL